jgi:hypothetical protein
MARGVCCENVNHLSTSVSCIWTITMLVTMVALRIYLQDLLLIRFKTHEAGGAPLLKTLLLVTIEHVVHRRHPPGPLRRLRCRFRQVVQGLRRIPDSKRVRMRRVELLTTQRKAPGYVPHATNTVKCYRSSYT